MVEVDCVVKKWGNSFGVLLPKDAVEDAGLKQNSKVHLIILKPSDVVRKSFGSLKGKIKTSGQALKDQARKELYD